MSSSSETADIVVLDIDVDLYMCTDTVWQIASFLRGQICLTSIAGCVDPSGNTVKTYRLDIAHGDKRYVVNVSLPCQHVSFFPPSDATAPPAPFARLPKPQCSAAAPGTARLFLSTSDWRVVLRSTDWALLAEIFSMLYTPVVAPPAATRPTPASPRTRLSPTIQRQSKLAQRQLSPVAQQSFSFRPTARFAPSNTVSTGPLPIKRIAPTAAPSPPSISSSYLSSSSVSPSSSSSSLSSSSSSLSSSSSSLSSSSSSLSSSSSSLSSSSSSSSSSSNQSSSTLSDTTLLTLTASSLGRIGELPAKKPRLVSSTPCAKGENAEVNRLWQRSNAVGYPELAPAPAESTTSGEAGQFSSALAVHASSREARLGLANMGNTCYMNSVLQVLSLLASFVDGLLASELVRFLRPTALFAVFLDFVEQRRVERRRSALPHLCAHCWRATLDTGGSGGGPEIACSSCRGTSWYCRAHDHCFPRRRCLDEHARRAAIRPTAVKERLDFYRPQFRGARQHDAHEFLVEFLDVLDEEIAAVWPPAAAAPPPLSPLELTFDFSLYQTLRCFKCDRLSETVQLHRCFSLYLPEHAAQAPTLAAMLRSFFQPTVVDFRCEACANPCAQRTFSFRTLPRILILHIKRFRADATKLGSEILCTDTLDLRPFCSPKAHPPLRLDQRPPFHPPSYPPASNTPGQTKTARRTSIADFFVARAPSSAATSTPLQWETPIPVAASSSSSSSSSAAAEPNASLQSSKARRSLSSLFDQQERGAASQPERFGASTSSRASGSPPKIASPPLYAGDDEEEQLKRAIQLSKEQTTIDLIESSDDEELAKALALSRAEYLPPDIDLTALLDAAPTADDKDCELDKAIELSLQDGAAAPALPAGSAASAVALPHAVLATDADAARLSATAVSVREARDSAPPSKAEYRLVSVISHHGASAQFGHYTALVLDRASGVWMHCDDSQVRDEFLYQVRELCKTAYIYFFECVD